MTEQIARLTISSVEPEFYLVHERRSASGSSYIGGTKNQFDPDPVESARCRDARIAALNGYTRPSFWSARLKECNQDVFWDLQGDQAFPNSRDQWPTRAAFKAACPQPLTHLFVIADYGRIDSMMPSAYIASSQWCQAIEDLEPNVHTFLPVALEFKDRRIEGFSWIFNKRSVGASWRFPDRPPVLVLDNGEFNTPQDTPKPIIDPGHASITARRRVLGGLHWARYSDSAFIFPYFASAELARRHRALLFLPNERSAFKYVPVAMTEI